MLLQHISAFRRRARADEVECQRLNPTRCLQAAVHQQRTLYRLEGQAHPSTELARLVCKRYIRTGLHVSFRFCLPKTCSYATLSTPPKNANMIASAVRLSAALGRQPALAVGTTTKTAGLRTSAASAVMASTTLRRQDGRLCSKNRYVVNECSAKTHENALLTTLPPLLRE